MSEMRNPKYQEKIVSKIKSIESALEDLTSNEMSAVVCAAITGVLVSKELRPVQIKCFYAELAAVAIEQTELAYMIYGLGGKHDTN